MRKFLLILISATISSILAPSAFAQQTATSNTAFDSWVMSCSSHAEKDKPTTKACEIRSTVVVQDKQSTQQGVAVVVAIGRILPEQKLQFVAQLPINSVLNIPVKITGKDDKAIVELTYAACQPQLCTATGSLTEAQISALRKAGDILFVVYRNQAGQDVKVEVSTKGFAAALDALVKEKHAA